MKICFIASSGGHLDEITMLKPMMIKYESFLVTEKTRYHAVYNNDNNMKVYTVTQINRRQWYFLFNFVLLFAQSFQIFIKEKPDVVISTGALATVPTCLLAKLFKKKIIYIETIANINTPTVTGRLLYHFADLFIIQWDSLKAFYPQSIFGGWIF